MDTLIHHSQNPLDVLLITSSKQCSNMHPRSRILRLKTTSVSVSSAVPGLDNCMAPCPSARIHLSCQGGMRRTVTLATALTGDLLRAAYNKHESRRGQTLWRRLCRVCIPARATFPVTYRGFPVQMI